MDKVVPYLISLDEPLPARSKATLLNEISMALVESISVYGKKINKFGKINKIAACFWPIRLIPLNDTRACVCSYLLNTQEKLDVGSFATVPPPPENIVKGADPVTFLDSLQSYNLNYLKKSKNYKRSTIIQEALFSVSEIEYFRNFLYNNYNLSTFTESYFELSGDAIAKSVDQIKIIQEVYDFVGLKDVNMLDEYGASIIKLCDRWISEGTREAEKIRGTTVDTKDEDNQLDLLNRELQAEKERKIEKSQEELIRSGKYKVPDKTGELSTSLSRVRNAIERLKNAISQKDLFLLDEGVRDLDLQYTDLGKAIDRYKNEIYQLKKNMDRELYESEKARQAKIREIERKISEVEKQIEDKHGQLSKDLSSAENIIVQIRQEKQSCLDTIEAIKDVELTNVQTFLKNYTIEMKTKNVVVGIPIFIFYFADPNTNKTTERAPVMPLLIDKGKVVKSKITEGFRKKLRDLMNKFTPVITLVETEGEKANLMDMKNLDTQLDESINDLRIRKVLKKKEAEKAKNIINTLIW